MLLQEGKSGLLVLLQEGKSGLLVLVMQHSKLIVAGSSDVDL